MGRLVPRRCARRDTVTRIGKRALEAGRVALALAKEFGLQEAEKVAERLTRGPGRPPGTVRKPQAGQVGVRLTVDERTWLRAEAERQGVSESRVIRRLIDRARTAQGG